MIPPPPRSPLFPYTTLFRSRSSVRCVCSWRGLAASRPIGRCGARSSPEECAVVANRRRGGSPRSEEHTSELQSHVNLVCRLLLEKKKKEQTYNGMTRDITPD